MPVWPVDSREICEPKDGGRHEFLKINRHGELGQLRSVSAEKVAAGAPTSSSVSTAIRRRSDATRLFETGRARRRLLLAAPDTDQRDAGQFALPA
jgi:hypothetical protein